MIGIFIALLSGALMSIQGVFNTEVTERTSILGRRSICTVNGIDRLFGSMGDHGPKQFYGIEKRRTEIYALRRSHRSLHHDHRY